MQLSKRTTDVPVQKSSDGGLTESQRKLFKVNLSSIAPCGKYKDKSLQWIQANDSSYWKWMESNDIAYSWNCIRLKSDAMAPKVTGTNHVGFRADNGEIWLGLRETGNQSQPANESWYK